MKYIKHAFVLVLVLVINLYCSNQSKQDTGNKSIQVATSNQSVFDCNQFKQFSKEDDLNLFTVKEINYNAINPKEYKSVNEYPILKNTINDGEVYFYSHLKDQCSLILLSKSIMDGNKSVKLYLVTLSNEDQVKYKLMLAEKTSYPGSFSDTYSKLNGDIFTITKIDSYVGDYVESENRYTTVLDSITVKYKLYDDYYKQLSKDSIRIER